MQSPPRKLDPFYGPPRGFSYDKEVQPIWDAKCVRCHNEQTPNGIDLRGVPGMTKEEMDKICCFIDLGIQFAGDYAEKRSERTQQSLQRYVDMRRKWEEDEKVNIDAYIQNETGNAYDKQGLNG